MRVCEREVYLPFTSSWVKVLRDFGVNEFSKELKVSIKTSRHMEASFYPAIKASVGSVRRIAERLLLYGESGVELWYRDFRWRLGREDVEWMVETRRGEVMKGKASVLIDAEAGPQREEKVSISTTTLGETGSLLDLSGPSIRLRIPHGSFETVIEIGGDFATRNAICRTLLPLGEEINLGRMPVLYTGFRSGIIKPPWIGDYVAASAFVSVQAAENWLSNGDLNQTTLSYLSELMALSRICLEVLIKSQRGGVGELELSYILEGLRPPPNLQL